jgi:hypothetical protein
MPETSIKEDVAAAMEVHDVPDDDDVEVVAHEETPEPEAQEAQEEEVQSAETEEPAGEPEPAAEPVEAAAEYNAPVAWSPTLKQEWENLNEDTRKGIAEYEHQRESQVQNVLAQSTESRRIADGFVHMVEPYRALMASEGQNDPFQALQGLLNVTAQLRMGSPQEKAQRIAGLIQHYGVDIETLDGVLAGQTPEQQQQVPQQPQQQFMDPRVDQMIAQRNQEVQNDAGQTIQQFASDANNEFYPNVRMQMADEMDMARQNGQHMDVSQAYETACWKNPEIRGILMKRNQDAALTSGPGMMQGKRNAASSISGKRGGATNAANSDMSLRETIEAQLADEQRV